jgi:hypothetical protein
MGIKQHKFNTWGGKKMKFLFCVAVIMTFLVAPFALDFTPTGKAYAMGGGGGSSDDPVFQSNSPRPAQGPQEPGPAHHAPEPGTLILLGVGLVGVAFYARNKFKK